MPESSTRRSPKKGDHDALHPAAGEHHDGLSGPDRPGIRQELSVPWACPRPARPSRTAPRRADDTGGGLRATGKCYIFGAFTPADGHAFTCDYPRRTIANWVDFLERAEEWISPAIAHVYGSSTTSTSTGRWTCFCSP